MLHTEFVEELKLSAPAYSDLKIYNLPDDYIEGVISNYICTPKQKFDSDTILNDPILNLINEFDCSSIQIGLISLSESVKDVESFIIIGNLEADYLVLNKVTLEIEVRDHDNPNFIIWSCAKNSNSFLEVLLSYASYIALKIKDVSLIDNDQLTTKIQNALIEKAGGSKYRGFYEMLLS